MIALLRCFGSSSAMIFVRIVDLRGLRLIQFKREAGRWTPLLLGLTRYAVDMPRPPCALCTPALAISMVQSSFPGTSHASTRWCRTNVFLSKLVRDKVVVRGHMDRFSARRHPGSYSLVYWTTTIRPYDVSAYLQWCRSLCRLQRSAISAQLSGPLLD